MVICTDNYLMTIILYERKVKINITRFDHNNKVVGDATVFCGYNSYAYKKLVKVKEDTENAEKTINHFYIMFSKMDIDK